MMLHPRVTRAGVALVKRFEGYRRTAARLAGGGFVIGYGHTLSAREGAEVSERDAEALLWFDLSRMAQALQPKLLAPVNDFQFDALNAFAFNIGLDNFAASEVLKRLNEGAYLQAAAALELWRRADFDGDARVVDALVRRRAAEKAHFLTPPDGFAPAPTPVLRPTLDRIVLAAQRSETQREAVVVTGPALEGRTAAATLRDPPGLTGGEPAPSAALAAVDAVSARLDRILAEPQPVDEPEAPLELPSTAAEPTPEPAQVLELAEPPPAAPEPLAANDAEATPEPEAEPPPPVRSFAFEPVPAPMEPGPAEPAAEAQVEELAGAPPVDPRPVAAETPRDSARVFGLMGLVGVVLFGAAMFAMLHHPSVLWLCAGLVGVVLIAPASAFFLFRLAERPPRA